MQELFSGTNSGRVICQTLPEDAEMFMFGKEEDHERVRSILVDESKNVVMLYPSRESVCVRTRVGLAVLVDSMGNLRSRRQSSL